MPHVLVAGRIHEAGLDLLRQASSISFRLVESTADDAWLHHLPDADALLLRTQHLTAADIARAPRLRVVSRHGVGYDAVDVGALSARGIPLTIVGDVSSRSVAEHAMMLLLAVAKKAAWHDTQARTGGWQCRNLFEVSELAGRTLLVVGFGRVGRLVAGMAAAFGMRVTACDPYVPADEILRAGAVPVARLMQALPQSDAVSLHLPFAAGEPLMGAAQFEAIKRGAILVNTARGGLVDQDALAAALRSGHLRGAGLDVLAHEPPAPSDPLLACANLVLSPHCAGLTEESTMRMAVAAVNNILDLFADRLDPRLVVNAAQTGHAARPAVN